jgi:hypothetical protein
MPLSSASITASLVRTRLAKGSLQLKSSAYGISSVLRVIDQPLDLQVKDKVLIGIAQLICEFILLQSRSNSTHTALIAEGIQAKKSTLEEASFEK